MPYFYKGYDLNNQNKKIKMTMEFQNPYGCNFDYSSKFRTNNDDKYCKTLQDSSKISKFNKKG